MTPELENTLIQRYPEIFKDAGGSPSETCMSAGLAVGDGWFNIIDVLCGSFVSSLRQAENRMIYLRRKFAAAADEDEKLDAARSIAQQIKTISEALNVVPVAAQVKEKFGSLRFYLNSSTPEQSALVSFAERMSSCTCETCGSPGQTYALGWMRTLCPTHADKAYGDAAAVFRAKAAGIERIQVNE